MHLGLIMDGNGRWAKQRLMPRSKGHEEGMKALKRVVLAAIKHNIDFLTVYVFSTENWIRPEPEVSFLMNVLAKELPNNWDFLLEHNIRIRHRGDLQRIPQEPRKSIVETLEKTAGCTGLTIVLAINYGGQDEIARSVNRFIKANPGKQITVDDIKNNLDNPDIPEPDMIARSAGEKRLSNFMLWDSAYAEFYFIDDLWPDWGEKQVEMCLDELSRRVRKFGGVIQ